MNISCEEYDQVAVVTIDGELSQDTIEAFKNTVQESVRDGHVDFIVNFEKVSLIDSQGLEALFWLKEQCRENHGMVKLAALDEISGKILNMTRIDQAFDICDEVIEAVKSFS